MSDEIFREGGPHNIRRTGPNKFTMSVTLPKDADERTARACPSGECSPAYFKVKNGTGITGGQTVAFCPYCRAEAKPDDFTTKSQRKYVEELLMHEAHDGMGRMIKKALGIGPSGKRKFGGGLFTMEMSLKQGSKPIVHRPFEEALQRAVICPHCTLDHAVFGLAVWCSDCGRDIFITHVQAEFEVVKAMLGDVSRREKELGLRVATRDIENSLEDVVSIYETVLRALFVRHLRQRGIPKREVESIIHKRIGNGFQSVRRSNEIIFRELAIPLFESVPEQEIAALTKTFEKRHPITHNLGVVDRKYLERIHHAEREGREVFVSPTEILRAIETVMLVVTSLHARLFPQQLSAPEVPPPGEGS